LGVCTKEEGNALVRAVRNSVELSIKSPKFKGDTVKRTIAHMKQFNSLQVRLIHKPTGTVRGSSMSTEVKPLMHAVVDASMEALSEQGKPISAEELGDTIVELHLMTSPRKLAGGAEARKRSITLGKDGVILKYGDKCGIVMPYSAGEKGWDKEAFMQEACARAGVPKSYWMQPNVSMYKFETQVFAEREPDGSIAEVY
jgi:hypothetical protein